MKVTYDPVVDALKITLSNVPIAESDEQSPGVILDYDQIESSKFKENSIEKQKIFLLPGKPLAN